MSYLCRPSGLLVLGLLGLAVVFGFPGRRKPYLLSITLAIGLCLLIAVVYEKLYAPWILGNAGLGYASSSILGRLRYLRFDDFSRLNYGLFPSGILPFVSLLAFRWQDSLARVISIVCLLYFILFYSQAFIALHHFVPVMVFPLVVFWRIYLHRERSFQRVSLPAVVFTTFIALLLSLPRHFEVDRSVRAIGQRTAYLVADYHTDYPSTVRHAELLFNLIAPDWKVKNPRRELVGGYCTIIHYSARPRPHRTPISYIVQPVSNPPPVSTIKIADNSIAAVYSTIYQQWDDDRFQNLRTDFRSPLYNIPRATLQITIPPVTDPKGALDPAFKHHANLEQVDANDFDCSRTPWRTSPSVAIRKLAR